jgi:hypothetical protein
MRRLRVVWIVNSELQGGSPPPVSFKACVGWVRINKHLIMYWRIWDLCGLTNLVACTVTELDDTPLYFTDVQWDNV